MAHEIYQGNGKASMMYVGAPPWHGLGTPLESPPTSARAIKAAGLDWEVRKFPLFASYGNENPSMRRVNRMALMPMDRIESQDCPVFGVVGPDYGIVQNRDAFKFFDPIISGKKAFYETAGALGNGERIWILAKIPGLITVSRNDTIEKYLLLSNSHTGLTSVQIKFTPVRVVCNNTLTMALSFGESIKIPHNPDVNQKLAGVGKVLKNIFKNYELLEKNFSRMARLSCDTAKFNQYLDLVMPVPELEKKASKAKVRQKERIVDQRKVCSLFFETGHENDPPEISHTLWSAYNAITYYSDYILPNPGAWSDVRTDQKEYMEKRLKRIWFGDAATLKVKAYDAAVKMLEAA